MIYYAGIGSRNCPENIANAIDKISGILAKKGFILRSGGAGGCDEAFEIGCDKFGGKKQIFLPWKNFNNNKSTLYTQPAWAEEVAFYFHPYINQNSKQSIIKLMSRNSMQILGPDNKENEHSKFVVCYTQDGEDSGGTGQALRIAKSFHIPVFNLYHKNSLQDLKRMVTELES